MRPLWQALDRDPELAPQTARDGALILDQQGYILDANDALSEMLGYTRDELLAMRLADLEETRTSNQTEGHIWRVFRQGFQDFATRFRAKDGRLVHLQVSASAAHDTGAARAFAFVRELGDRSPGERAIGAGEQRYRLLVENSPTAIFVHEFGGVFRYANPAAVELFGLESADALLGRNYLEFVHPEERAEAETRMRQFTEGRRPADYVIRRLVRPSGEVRIVSTTGISFREGERQLVQGIALDIDVNDSYLRFTGYPREALIGKTTLELGLVADPDRRAWRAARMQSGSLRDAPSLLRTRSGELRDCLQTSFVVHIGHDRCWVSVMRGVTEAKRVERALQASEGRLQQVVRVSGIGIFDHDQRTDAIYWSPEQRRIYGWDAEQPVTLQKFIACVHPEDVARVGEEVRRAHSPEGNGLFDIEYRIIRRDGQTRWLTTRSQTFFEGEGSARRPVRTVGGVMDITERVEAEQAIRHSAALLAEAQRTAHLGNFERNLVTGKAIWSDETYRLLGFEPGSVEPRMESVLKVVHPDDQEAFVAAYERSRRPESGGDYAVEHRMLLPDGSERILRHQAKVTFDETGKPVRIFGTSQDVTEARLSERALRESEARFQTLIETVPDAVVVHVDGRYVYANPAALDLLGLASADAIIGKDAVSIVHPDSRELVRERIRRHQLGEPVPRKTEQRWLRSDGTAIDVEVTGIPFLLNGKRAVHVMAHDITERKRADQELRLAATAFESHEGIFITDSKGRILRANRAFTEITGYSSQEAAGRSASMLSSEQHDLAFPLAVQAALDDVGSWQGEIYFRRSSGELYPVWQSITAVKRDDGQVTHFVCHFQDISERKQVQARIEHLAYHDPLTLLPNRSMLLDRLQHALARNRRRGLYGALLFMDLDRFKNINDSLGHRTGDLLLREVGSCVAREIRDEDTVARLGGDEFVVLLADLGQNRDAAASEARALAERIHEAVSRNFNVAGYTLRVGASIGVTVFPVADETADDILRHADIAMYRAKAAGRGTVCFFSPDMQAAASERLELEGQLRHALERGEFTLHFQPQVEFSTGRIRGAESLMRWTRPQRGALSPGLFVPVLEESGLILAAGEWVLRSACRTASLLTRFRADLRVAVNVSPRQLHQSSFAEGVRSILHECSIRPEAIELEITEGAVIQDVDHTVKVMTALKDLGVRFSLDDFGTGYSSLSYVKRLPLDTLKIDQAFVRDCTTDPNDAAIVRAIIAMAHSLGLDVIAEGVEQDAQHRFLRELGCTAYQGFLFSPPLPEGQFLSLLRSGGAGHEGGG